ncbi:MAG: bifunctional serine/threonine-protein kinase/formylglycine-generating enzyme family protein [Deltaproteobacteria bacterium]|nr:bifunctional serine/threonine-protein kinase/formylglycine-generating enzyme family protein [Deltaproteobacteria bacterium]
MLCKKCGSYNPEGTEVCSICKEPILTKSFISLKQKVDIDKLLVQVKTTVNERYLVTRFIGEGTFAQVFYAIDKATNSGVALKIFKPFVFKNEDEMSRLVWGVRGIKDISHPNLVRIFDSDISHEGWVYISMKFIYGMSLKNTIKLRSEVKKPFSFEEIEPLFFQIGEILNEIHPTICHGDFKPSNIIIQPDYIKLTDTTILNYITLSNCITQIKEDKSNIYLAPEVFEGNEPSYRSDIYSCGKILQTLLTGSEETNINKVQLFEYDETIDKRLRNLIIKATDVDPLARYNDVNEFNAELFEILSIYNDLPQGIKDEYHKKISAVETKFTHIKSKIESTGTESRLQSSGKSFGKRVYLLVLFFLFSILIAFSIFLYDRYWGLPVEKKLSTLDIFVEDISEERNDLLGGDIVDVGFEFEYDIYVGDVAGVVEKSVDKPKERLERVVGGKGVVSVERQKIDEKRKEETVKDFAKLEKEDTRDNRTKGSEGCPKDMVYIKAGSFRMGSVPGDEGRQADELAFVSVSTHSYCIDKYEFPNKKGVMPRTSVSFEEAEKLCMEQGKRICSEEEWERACKGTSMLKYPYDNIFDPNACNAESNLGEEKKVAVSGSFPKCKSTYGVYDMSGNVAEWVLMKGGQKGVKGGYVNKPDWAVRCASRRVESPTKRSPYYGFRCCMDVDE